MKKLLFYTVSLFFIGVIGPSFVDGQVADAVTPSYLSVNISGTSNANDFPFGICSDGTYRYMTLHNQGAIVKILISDNSYSIYNNNAIISGEDWYSCVVANGKVYINEKDTGLVRVFNPTTNSFLSSIAIPQNIAGGVVSYTSSHSAAPHDITIAGVGTHLFGFGSFGELKFTNGYVWQLIDYVYNFSAAEETAGATDISFHGVARIDPSTDAVTRYAIAGAQALRGISVDVTDNTILWITDNSANKLYKFDTDTGLVTDTINLPAGTNARGVTNNASFVLIAENDSGGTGVTGKILKVAKSDFTTEQIDTGASIPTGKSGVFSVYMVNDDIVWTDQANHVGVIRITNTSLKTIVSTSGTTDSNHFGLVEGTNFVFAGQGSVVQGSLNLAGDGSGRGDSCAGDCYAPHLGYDQDSRFFYDDGLKINNKKYEVKNVLHNLSDEIIELPVGIPVNIVLKVQDTYPNNVESCEVALGIKHGHFIKQDASFIIGTTRTFDGVVSTYYEGDLSGFRDAKTSMINENNNVIVKVQFVPTKHLKHDMFAVECKDIHNYSTPYFFNHGILFKGVSEVGTPVFDYIDNDGLIHELKILDKTLEDMSIAVDENGNLWHGNFGKFWNKEYQRPDMTGSLSKYHGYDRNDYFEFRAYKIGQELIAKQEFDSEKIQKQIKPSFTHEVTFHERLYDPVPKMMKAIGELAIKSVGKR